MHKCYNTFDLTKDFGIGYDTHNQEFYFDLEDYEKIKDYYWYSNKQGYFKTEKMINGKRTTIFLHRFILNLKDKNILVDHINRKRNDCRKENLRQATTLSNSWNQSLRPNNTSGIIGVTKGNCKNTWIPQIVINNKAILLKSCKSKEEAIKIRLLAEYLYFGNFAPQSHLFKKYNIIEEFNDMINKSEKVTGKIFIINGTGASGKSTFCKYVNYKLGKNVRKTNICGIELSVVDYVKEIAKYCGWQGEKTEKARKFLSDLYIALKEYNNSPFSTTLNKIYFYLKYTNRKCIFVNIREPKDIEEFKNICIQKGYEVKTILVTNPNVPIITSNVADAGVNNYKYDIYLKNDKGLNDWKKQAYNFALNIIEIYS